MEYLVIGADGTEYGPADRAGLRLWVEEGRIVPETQLRSFQTGDVLEAKALPGLFPEPPDLLKPRYEFSYSVDEGRGDLWRALLGSVLTIPAFMFLHTLGVFVAGIALYYAIQSRVKGNRYGTAAIVVTAITVLYAVAAWIMKLGAVIFGA